MKTNFKRLLAVVLSALLLASSFSVVAFADDVAPAAENLAATATVVADGKEVTEITDGDIATFYAAEEPVSVGYHQYGSEVVFTLAKRSFVGSVEIAAYNWAAKNACTTFKVYVLVDGEWVYVATADMPADSADETITGTASFEAVMTDAVKVVAEAVGKQWMPKINEVEIYSKDLGADGFDDVADEDWYATAVAYVKANGLMEGEEEVIFNPAGTLTYAMMAQVLYNMAGNPAVDAESTFADVDPEAWYADAAAWAEANGIATGDGKGNFNPDAAIVRADIAAYLYNYARYINVYTADRGDLSAFEDVADATIAMKWAAAAGLFEGRTETEYAPTATATRAEVATLLMRFDLWVKAATPNYVRNVAVQGTAYASSERSSKFVAANAVDGNAGSYWQAMSEKAADGKYTGTAVWGIKLEEAFDIDRITLTVGNYRTWGTVAGVDYKIEALVNGAWKTIATVNDADAYSATAKAVLDLELAEIVTATEIKITATSSAEEASYVKAAIYELVLNGIEAGRAEVVEKTVANATGGATAEASSSTNNKNLPANAIDESVTTAWMSLDEKDENGNSTGANLVLTWEEAIAVRNVEILVNNYASWGLEAGVDYVVEALVGGKWVEIMSFNDVDAGNTTAGTVAFEADFACLYTNSIKITGVNYGGSVKPKVFDVKVNALGLVNYVDINVTSSLGVTGSFAGGANAWSGGFGEIFDSNDGSSAAWTPDSVLNITFAQASTFDFINILANNHDPASPGFWGDKDLILNVEIVCGETSTTIEWSQRANSDDTENGKIAAKVDTSAFEGITAINITTKEACKWFSYIYEITFGNVEAVLSFN